MSGGRTVDVFFFQAEDGIRDIGVTGVQTCALPISRWRVPDGEGDGHEPGVERIWRLATQHQLAGCSSVHLEPRLDAVERSEERRVGKECRSRWSPYH